MDALSANPERR